MQDPSPTQCQYHDDEGRTCDQEPIVGINDLYVCKDHVTWALDHFPKPSDILAALRGDHG